MLRVWGAKPEGAGYNEPGATLARQTRQTLRAQRHDMRNTRLGPMILMAAYILFLVTSGCAPATPVTASASASPASRPISLITPVDFFSSDQKRLSQHLHWQTGCFQVKYAGPPARIRTRIRVVEKGKPDQSGGSSTSQAGDHELSISVREDEGNPGSYRVTEVLSSGSGNSSGSMVLPRPKLGHWKTRVTKILHPEELVPGREIDVWALMQFKSDAPNSYTESGYDSSLSIAEQIKKADWAIVLKVVIAPESEAWIGRDTNPPGSK